jgi:uncharacterized protein YggT (Ycf19 family)
MRMSTLISQFVFIFIFIVVSVFIRFTSSRAVVIVLTQNRLALLQSVLASLRAADFSPDVVDLFVRIDRFRDNSFNSSIVDFVTAFDWPHGQLIVRIAPQHDHIVGQWLNCARDVVHRYSLFVVFEDDVIASPLFYQWVKAAHAHYATDPRLGGVTLQPVEFVANETSLRKASHITRLYVPTLDHAYFYKQVGPWGFSPSVPRWIEFMKWYDVKSTTPGYRPYIEGILPTQWFKMSEAARNERSIWTMWFLRFCEDSNLYTLYPRFPKRTAFSANERPSGAHFQVALGRFNALVEQFPRDKQPLFPPQSKTITLNWAFKRE